MSDTKKESTNNLDSPELTKDSKSLDINKAIDTTDSNPSQTIEDTEASSAKEPVSFAKSGKKSKKTSRSRRGRG